MAPIDLIIDDNGHSWQTGSPALLRNLRIDHRGFDLVRYVIRNLGFVRVRIARNATRITLYPRFLTKAAFEALVCAMVTQDSARFVIEDVGAPNRLEIIPGVEDAAARIADLASSGGEVMRADYYSEELSLSRLRNNERLAPLSGLMRRWQSSRGILPDTYSQLFESPALGGRTVVVRMVNGEQPVVDYVGAGFDCFSQDWRSMVIGRDIGEQPDRRYGQLVAQAYSRTHLKGSPRLELVEAVIRTPGCSPRRSRYERLLLPWRRNGHAFVSAASVLRTSFCADART